MNAVLVFILGLVALIGGAEMLVRGGAALAARLGISPMVIGATIVALGTSAPELAIGIDAAITGNGALAVGNIAGTNTINILLILGLTAMLRPVPLRAEVARWDLPMVVAASVLMVVFALDGDYTLLDGVALVAVGLAYTAVIVRAARRDTIASRLKAALAPPVPVIPRRRQLVDVLLLLVGIVLLVVGAGWLVDGAVDIAAALGVSEALVGLTIVAIGTSAPELVTAIVATLRHQRDIAVGNLLGSTVFNIVFIFGATILASGSGIEVETSLVVIDLPVMLLAALACIPIFLTGRRIRRIEGALLVGGYFVYLGSLILFRT